jgi:transposase
VLQAGERERLERWARDRTERSLLAVRSRILLACASGADNVHIATELGVSAGTVGKWRSRFLAEGLAGLADRPRSGRPKTLADNRVESIVSLARGQAPPAGTSRWTTRRAAAATGVSQSTVSRVWRKHGIQPGRIEPVPELAPPQVVSAQPGALHAALDGTGAKIVDSIASRPRGKKLLEGARKARRARWR